MFGLNVVSLFGVWLGAFWRLCDMSGVKKSILGGFVGD